MNPEEVTRSWNMQMKGIVKYFDPEIPWLIDNAISSAVKLIENKSSTQNEIKDWIMQTNPKWWPVIRKGVFKRTFAKKMYAAAKSILKKLGLK
jgi:predicted naringenin-chalcone synthase